MPCRTQWSIVHRPLVSTPLCLLLSPSSSSRIWNALSIFPSPDLFSRCFLVILKLMPEVLYGIHCHCFISTCVRSSSIFFFEVVLWDWLFTRFLPELLFLLVILSGLCIFRNLLRHIDEHLHTILSTVLCVTEGKWGKSLINMTFPTNSPDGATSNVAFTELLWPFVVWCICCCHFAHYFASHIGACCDRAKWNFNKLYDKRRDACVCGCRDRVYVEYDSAVNNVALIAVIVICTVLFVVFIGVLVGSSISLATEVLVLLIWNAGEFHRLGKAWDFYGSQRKLQSFYCRHILAICMFCNSFSTRHRLEMRIWYFQ